MNALEIPAPVSIVGLESLEAVLDQSLECRLLEAAQHVLHIREILLEVQSVLEAVASGSLLSHSLVDLKKRDPVEKEGGVVQDIAGLINLPGTDQALSIKFQKAPVVSGSSIQWIDVVGTRQMSIDAFQGTFSAS